MNELEWCFRPTFRRHRAQDSRSPTRFGILDPTVHQCRQIMLILLIMTVFWWCRRHSGRGHSREGWAWWATDTTVSTADELAGSGWKWMEVNLEGGRDVLPSPKRTGTLEPFTWSISWSVQTCLFGCTHSVRSLPVCRFENEIRHWQNVYSNQLDLFMSVHGLYLVAVQWNQKQSRHFL